MLTLSATPSHATGAKLAGVYLIYTYYAGYMIALSMYQANTAGHTKSRFFLHFLPLLCVKTC